jgi:hypothetical protein
MINDDGEKFLFVVAFGNVTLLTSEWCQKRLNDQLAGYLGD